METYKVSITSQQVLLSVAYSTIAYNQDDEFTLGISNTEGGTVTLQGTLIDEDNACNGPVLSEGYNILSGFPGDGCKLAQQDTDLQYVASVGLLERFTDNGGPTQTYALDTNSVAIDAIPADVCELDTDQRGVSRPQGSACDVGAFERKQ